MAVYHEWEAITDKMLSLSYDAMTVTELLNLQSRREVVARAQPVADHQIIALLAAQADPKALGAKNLADLLATRRRRQRFAGHRPARPQQFCELDALVGVTDRDAQPTPPRRIQGHLPCGVGVRRAGPTQRATRHHHRDRRPTRPGNRRRSRGHRRGHPTTDARRDPASVAGPSLPGHLRQTPPRTCWHRETTRADVMRARLCCQHATSM